MSLLTGDDAGDILRTAVGAAGGTVLAWRANQVDHREGGTTAGYQVRVRWPGGRVREERFAACTGPRLPAGALVVGDGTEQVAVWRFPHDPFLPALATAYHPVAAGRLLRSWGLGDLSGGAARLQVRAYRPRRRAVVEARWEDGHRLFLKVVRPAHAETLHQRHEMCGVAGVPVPASLGYTPEGLLVLAALPGSSLRQALREPGTALPSPAEILSLLDRLPPPLADQPPRRSWRDRVGYYAEAIAGAMPEQATRARQLAAAITAESGTGPIVPVHGDFYEGQLRVAGGRISGLLDLDTAGPGDRLDDLACLLGHLSVLPAAEPAQEAVVSRLGADYLAAFARAVDAVELRYRVAAVVLSLATGPYRVQQSGWRRATEYRLSLAERWLAGARTLAGR